MSPRSLLFSVLAVAYAVNAQSTFPPTALADKRFPSPTDLPYKVDTDEGLIRGTQHGFNMCNSTTENQQSNCQTSYINGIDDFCLWGPPDVDSSVADTEGEMVAWCTKPGHGTRLIPAGAITGLQWMKTPDYVQIVGFLDQSKINIKTGDAGGEMDPHGADLRGNPMGGVMFSNAFNGQYQQVVEWHNFIGLNSFCLKACDPKGAHAADYCQHIYDRIGCTYNAPNHAQDKVFEACEGDNQDFPGVYTSNGQVVTYTQPAESLGAITTMPYEPRVPSSSNCKPFSSAQLFASLPTVGSSATITSGSPASTGVSGSGTPKSTSSAPKPTGSNAANNNSTGSSDASTLAISGISFMGVLFSALFLA